MSVIIFPDILAQGISVYTEGILGEYKCGCDHIFTIRQILEKLHNISLHQLYIYFKQAFDSIGRFQIKKQ
jgi:hypothetical protein